MGIVENTYAELKQQELKNNPYSCLHMADIDINPHQVEAFTFALSSLELGGAILADEVGLGKTIEAGLVIKYLLCSGKNKILLIMPSNLRKQWQVELEEKFDIDSLIVDSSNWEDYLARVKSKQAVIIVSYHFASKRKTEFGKIAWDFCVFDEAHRLRNVYKNGSKMANSLYELTKGIQKILLTATPMQNTLLDIYGLVQFIDDRVFYSKQIFSERYLRGEDYNDLKACLEPVVQRTLRKEVAEYIQFSERKEMTIDFELSPMEIELYVMINNYLKKEILYALPNSHRTLITSVIRKLLASSSMAVAETFKVLKGRLETLKETTRTESADDSIDFFLSFFDDDEIETDNDSKQDELYTREKVNEFIQHEIDEVTAIINKAERIKRNAKMTALKQAVETAFAFQDEAGIKQRIVVFTESIRTQQYMFEELSHAGYEGQILKFNGSTNDPVTKQIYKAWKARNYGKYVGSRNVELKNAIVEAFRDEYKILLVTDSGSEGLNLQFCNTIINYDLPWNPQKIEQRIGRCHRYGQKNDVVVINLLNTQNVADKRVYEILSEKFELFQGVFGASDKAIGLLESGADFEKRVTLIYQECKTTSDFTKQFKDLEKELEKKRNKKMDELKSIFIYKTEEQHKSHFNSIMKEIAEYDSQFKYWNSRSKEENEIYPKYYETNIDLEIPGIQHGYLLVGGSYVGEILEDAVFEMPAVENQQISLFDEALCESKVKSYQDLNNENVVENLFAEYQKAFVKKVAPKKSESDSGQMSIFDYFANDDEKETNDGTASDHKMTQTGMGTDAVDTSFTVHQGDASLQIDLQKSSGSKNVLPYAKQEFIKKVEELKKVAISVPKIGISYSSTITFKPFTVKRNIMDFDVAASRIERYDAVNGKLLQVLDADALIVENPENMLAVSLLESIPEFSSDDAEFILEVVDQYLALIEGTDEEKKKIVRRYATVIVEDLRKQIYASKEESTEFVFNVQKDLIVFKSFAKNMKENGRLNFKKEVPDKKNIKQYLFEGYKKSYYAENAFDSDDERRLSVVLEEDSEVIRFIKPPLNQLGLFYKAAKQYNPDFLVETADKKYMIEVKAAYQTDNEDVQEKAKAAIKWCECASQVDADGKTWEYRLVPGDKIIVGNTFKYVIGMAILVVVDGE